MAIEGLSLEPEQTFRFREEPGALMVNTRGDHLKSGPRAGCTARERDDS